ncbi:MAG: SwmB domain-containing protein [Rhodospirillales bacterium]|nr:SwmB domain-containing protein [Rhodospirillales bacterium]MDE0377673.1 SwmB domain-containing protein [Rhodospirillales bacterium]
MSSDAGADATYVLDETIRITLTFGGVVDVTGAPRLKIDLGPGAGDEEWAVYEEGSGTTMLKFAYKVAQGDASSSGIAVLANTLELNGGAIRSAGAMTDANLAHAGLDYDPAHKVDGVIPRLYAASVEGATLTLIFNETLGAAASLANGAFTVKKTPQGGAEQNVRLSGSPAVSGAWVSLTLANAVLETDTDVKVSYSRPTSGTGNRLTDEAGQEVASFAEQPVTNGTPDTTPPRVERGEVDGGTITLYFSEPLDPDAVGGTFSVVMSSLHFYATGDVEISGDKVTVGVGPGNPRAQPNGPYARLLYFGHHAAPGERLRDFSGNVFVGNRFYGGDDPYHVLHNVTGMPSVTGVAVSSDAGGDATYGLGDTIRIRLTFSKTVTVTGTPRVKIDFISATGGEQWAAYEEGSGTKTLDFAYEVAEPNVSTQGIAVLANTLELNGGTIESALTAGENAALAHAGLGHDTNHKVDWQASPDGGAVGSGGADSASGNGGPPSVTGVAVTSDAGADATYGFGETIRATLTFSAPVTVTGSPALKIDMDPAAWGTKQAAYEDGGGTSSLTFAYEVTEPNLSTQGIAVLANTLALNGGTIRSAGGTDAELGHTGLGHNSSHKVDWRPSISVADASANEGAGAKVAFEVSLSRAFTSAGHRVTVDYATADGSATAGEDYTATSGTLTFAAGERTKTVNVPVLDDSNDEGEETFVLRLSNATGGRIADGEATGTIANDDPLQKMWLSRFGRTVADHVTGAVSDRLANPLSGAQVTVAGQRVDLAQTDDGAALAQALTGLARAFGASETPGPGDGFGSGLGQTGADRGSLSSSSLSGASGWPGTATGLQGSSALAGTTARDLSGRELLLGGAFHLAHDGDGTGPGLAAWGRVTVGGFDGEERADDGRMRIDGEVTTGILGADAAWNRLLAGVAISVSEGEGSFSQPGVDKGSIESTMTTVSPYARFMVTDRVSVWGLAGWGTGDMTIVQAANENQPERIARTDLETRLAALGGRGTLMQADETGGFDLGLRADAFHVETGAEAFSNEGDTAATASRVRLALEGSRAFRMEGGGIVTPGVEFGLCHDGGDAETGTGVELGGSVTWTDPATGLGVEARARTLIAHEDSDYREWGASGAVRLAPGDRGRGLSFSLAPTWGSASSGVDRLWGARDARGLAPGTGFEAGRRLEGELGYGLGLLGDRFTGTPNVGFGLSDNARDWRLGWRLTSVVRGDPGFEVNLDATWRETANDDGPAEHGVMLRGAIRW